MFTADVQMDVVLSTKVNAPPTRMYGKIRMIQFDDGTMRWGYLGEHDFRMPTGGPFTHENGEVVLQDTQGAPFAKLTAFPDPPPVSAAGAVFLIEPASKTYGGAPIQWRGAGKWGLTSVDIPPSVTQASWNALCHNVSMMGRITPWYLVTTGGWSVAGGSPAMKGYGGEYMQGTVVVRDERNPKKDGVKAAVPAVRLKYSAIGGGYMTPGVGLTLAPESFKNKCSYLTRGFLPTGDQIRWQDLLGYCAIVEGSGSVTFQIPKAWAGLTAGGGGALSMFLFGLLGGPGRFVFTSYKLGGVVLGPSVTPAAYGKKTVNLNAGFTLNFGTMTFDSFDYDIDG